MPVQELAPGLVADQPDQVRRRHDVGEHERLRDPLRRTRRGRCGVAQQRVDPLQVERGAEPLEHGARGAQVAAAAAWSPSAVNASAYRRRARALSYGRSVSCHSRHDRPRMGEASDGRSSPRSNSPRPVRAPASNTGLWNSAAINSSSATAAQRSRGRLRRARCRSARVAGGPESFDRSVLRFPRSRPARDRSMSPPRRPRHGPTAAATVRAGRRGRTRRPVRMLRPRLQVAHAQSNLSDLVIGVADGIQEPEPLELVARLAGLLLCFRPGPRSILSSARWTRQMPG